jgi:hypothetical protein
MAARDILNLSNPIAPRLIRCLYIVMLILIALLVILGIARGIRVMTLPPLPRPAIAGQPGTAPGAPNAAQPQPPGPGAMMNPGMMNPGQRQAMRDMMARRFTGRARGPFAMGGLGPFPRQPLLSGVFIIFFTLLRGAVALLVVRILAEMGLAVLAMPRRSEA